MAERTVMVMKADLQCARCYRKIKRLLCRFYEIRDHLFDEKQNTVTITVYCCSPEKIRQKIISKGGKTIQSIEIIQPQKPSPPAPKPAPGDAPKPEKAPVEKPKDKPVEKPAEKPVEKAAPKEPAHPKAEPPKKPDPAPKPDGAGPPKAKEPPAEKKAEAGAPKEPKPAGLVGPPQMAAYQAPVNGYPQPVYQIGMCYTPYYEGYPEAVYNPWYPGYGPPPPVAPAPYYENNYGRPCHCGRNGCGSCCDYFSEENPSSCAIM